MATICSVTAETNITESQACACVAGVCSVGVTGLANYNGAASFNFSVTASGLTSNTASATLSISSVPDIGGSFAFSGVADTSFTRNLIFTSLTLDETINKSEVCISEDVDLNGTISAGEKCNTQTWLDITANIGSAGTSVTTSWNNYRIVNNVNGASFIAPLAASCSSTKSYVNHLRVRSSASSNWGESASSSWTFWLPSCQSNMAIWLDGQDSSKIFANTACTTAISNNTKVACWMDKSGNTRNVTQATPATQPTYFTSLINSNPGLTFSGNALQTSANATWLNATNYTLISVVSNLTTKTSNYFLGLTSTTANRGLHIGRRTSTQLSLAQYSNDKDYNISTSTAAQIHVAVKSGTAANNRLYSLDGTVLTPTSADGASVYFSGITSPLNVGAGFNLTTALFAGDYAESIIYTTDLSVANRQRIEGYLAHKWGTTGSLVTGHPYISNPP